MAMERFLSKKYENMIITKDYIVAIGDIPIALVAHMDTVYKTPVTDLYYDKKKNVMWSPQGLGADDRAGIFAIIKILHANLRPTVIFTTDEEQGGVGATALGATQIPTKLKYLIELDRHGKEDCVFYDCYNEDFIEYVEGFGFKEAYGSFSDISFLMGPWQTCGVNLSVGYEEEHSYIEHLFVDALLDTIDKVKIMLVEKDIPDFKYDEAVLSPHSWFVKDIFGQHCNKCKKLYSEYELFPVKGIDGKGKFYCPDCIVSHVEWCDYCGEAFEKDSADTTKICKECAEELCTTKSSNNSSK